jgi:hypothetical protein
MSRTFRPAIETLEERALMSVGSEFHINTNRAFDQDQVAVASQPAVLGRSVAVWTSVDEIGSGGRNIRAQIFDGSGNRVGGEIVVAGIRFINESQPSVAMDAQGRFVVAWTEEDGLGDTMIRGQRFFANGVKNGGVMTLANDPTRKEFDPDVAMDAAGNFVVSFTFQNEPPLLTQARALTVNTDFLRVDTDILARRFSSNGTLLGTIVVAGSTADERNSSIARSPDGRFSIAFQKDLRLANGGIDQNINLKRFSATGTLLGNHSIAASARPEIAPDVAMDRAGNTIVVWNQFSDFSIGDVMARKVSANGIVGDFMFVASALTNEINPTVAMDLSDGDFVVAYERFESGQRNLIVREFSTTGVRKNNVNLGQVGFQPALAINDSDLYFMAYTSTQRADDNGLGIRGRRGSIV